MSNNSPSTGVAHTLAGGVQDVAAILPLIGTEQCEQHVGSALTGGYLYAAAAPLSIFGSLGIVKAGITIFISSISISIPHLSFLSCDSAQPVKYPVKRTWLGARMLKDAGFEHKGVVAPLIGMDGSRFRAETRLMEMLEEKHIDDPEKISIDWKSHQWNIMLILSTILGSIFSVTPYIALFLGPESWRPTSIHLPWLFPALRIFGSCIATVACQFLIQSRVISLMKNRIMFMIIDRRLNAIYKEEFDAWLKDPKLQWDANFPAEQCISSLKHYIFSSGSLVQPEELLTMQDNTTDPVIQHPTMQDNTSEQSPYIFEEILERPNHISFQIDAPSKRNAIPIQGSSAPFPVKDWFNFKVIDLHKLHQEYFPAHSRDAAFNLFSWILLGISLPATVAGYVGCFTLVGATPKLGNGSLIWLSLEAALSILRIVIWASNPSFDEETDLRLGLKLSEHQPLITTDDYNPNVIDLNHRKIKPLTLVPEHEFLEHITPFTGPLDQFQKADGIALYFTMTTDYHSSRKANGGFGDHDSLCILMTLFDVNMGIGVTVIPANLSFHYYDVQVKYNAILRRMEADIQSEKMDTHPWRVQDDNLFDCLKKYYKYLVASFNQRVTSLTARWDLSLKSGSQSQGDGAPQSPILPFVTLDNQSYLDRGYEHQLKTDLVAKWSRHIVSNMGDLQSDRRLDCHNVLRDVTSEKAKWELAELDCQLVRAWATRELVLLTISVELEDVLRSKMNTCASNVSHVRHDQQVGRWMRWEFESRRQKRMEQERGAAKQRMEKASKDASEQADREGRPWQEDVFLPQWTSIIKFIDKQWSAGINNQHEELSEAKYLLQEISKVPGRMALEREKIAEQLTMRVFPHHNWPEEALMKEAIKCIGSLPADSTRKELDTAYQYPSSDRYTAAKFAKLQFSTSKGKTCSAIVYDAENCDQEATCEVIAKRTTRSVINVDPRIIASIPPNDHLLFLSCKHRKGEEPPFVKQNRDRWWNQQTGNASLFYFTPAGVANGTNNSCFPTWGTGIAQILVFLTATSAIRVSVLHHKSNREASLSIRENGQELANLSDVPSNFQLDDFRSFVLQPGRHELELVPDASGDYFLRDVFITISDVPTAQDLEGDSS